MRLTEAGIAAARVLLPVALATCVISGCDEEEGRVLGETCSRDGQCASGRCDELLCKSGSPHGEDEPCVSPYDCASENCMLTPLGGRCGPGLRTLGDPCTDDHQCSSGRCVAASCSGEGVDAAQPAPDAGVDARGDSILDSSTVDARSPGTTSWSKGFGGAGLASAGGIAIDDKGNIFLAGSFYDTLELGGGPLPSAGDRDAFLASFDRHGAHRWSKRFGDAAYDQGMEVAVGPSDTVFYSGRLSGVVDFGGGDLTSAGNWDIVLAAFDGSGDHRWSRRFGDFAYDTASGITLDANENLYVTGDYQGDIDFGGGSLGGVGGRDVHLASLDANGIHRWSRRFGGIDLDHGLSVALDLDGNVFVAGYYQGSVDFGGGELTASGGYDAFVASYDGQGGHRWSKRFGNLSTDGAYALAVDGAGNVTVTGFFTGLIDFGGGNLAGISDLDTFVASFDNHGQHRWSIGSRGAEYDVGGDIVADAGGNVFVIGPFDGTVEFGGPSLTSAGESDAYVVSFDSDGLLRWSRRFGGPENDHGAALALTPDGGVVATGSFRGEVDFGDGPLTSVGDRDIFLVELAP